jgi:8-oxo-dGTP pyrophosphatase MutT (NUDIX family)
MPQVVTALVEDNDKIFIAQRSKDDELPLMWEFPAAKSARESQATKA